MSDLVVERGGQVDRTESRIQHHLLGLELGAELVGVGLGEQLVGVVVAPQVPLMH